MIYIKNFISKINTEKKVTILIVSILLVFVILINSTYSLVVQNKETGDMSYSTGILRVTSEAINNSVTLTNSLPMSDTDGAALSAYTFKITNTGTLNYEFDVKLLSTNSSNQISAQYIKIKVNNDEIKTLNNLTNGIILENVTLAPSESIDVNLRVWLASNTPNSQIGKQFSGKVTTEGYAIYTERYDDLVIENMPIPTGTYTVDTSGCEDVTMTYDYTKKGFRISNILLVNRAAICSPVLEEVTRTTLSDYIISLLGTSSSVTSTSNSDGSALKKITENGEVDYRYTGIDPNNYILFNDELWRIIGVFDENTHGIADTHLVKIIRNDSIGAYVWDNAVSPGTEYIYGWNNFPDSDIYRILNTAYYNSIDGTGSDYCYSYGTTLPANCDFTGSGIKSTYRGMIESGVNWFLGGARSASYSDTEMYDLERGTVVYEGNDVSTYAADVTTPIGLIYLSDYGYSAYSCSSDLSSYSSPNCGGKNWLNSFSITTTLTSLSGESYKRFIISLDGSVVSSDTINSFSIKPTLYLKSDIYYVGGTGSKIDPYIISQ